MWKRDCSDGWRRLMGRWCGQKLFEFNSCIHEANSCILLLKLNTNLCRQHLTNQLNPLYRTVCYYYSKLYLYVVYFKYTRVYLTYTWPILEYSSECWAALLWWFILIGILQSQNTIVNYNLAGVYYSKCHSKLHFNFKNSIRPAYFKRYSILQQFDK